MGRASVWLFFFFLRKKNLYNYGFVVTCVEQSMDKERKNREACYHLTYNAEIF